MNVSITLQSNLRDMGLGTVLQASQVLLAVAISLVPLYYQRMSIFSHQSKEAIDRLSSNLPRDTITIDVYDDNKEEEVEEELDLRWVEINECGFGKIVDIIKNEGVESGQSWSDEFIESISLIGVADGSTDAVGAYTEDLGRVVAGPQAVMYIEYTDDSREIVLYEPFAANRVRNMIQLKGWVRERLRKRTTL